MICHPAIEFQVERYHERIVSVKPAHFQWSFRTSGDDDASP